MSKQKPKPDETKADEPLWNSDEENKTKNNETKNEKEDALKEKNALLDLGHYKPAFRELDMEVD